MLLNKKERVVRDIRRILEVSSMPDKQDIFFKFLIFFMFHNQENLSYGPALWAVRCCGGPSDIYSCQ